MVADDFLKDKKNQKRGFFFPPKKAFVYGVVSSRIGIWKQRNVSNLLNPFPLNDTS